MSYIKVFKPLFYWILPSIFILICITKFILHIKSIAIDIMFPVILSSLVGYYTNYFAIKMIFKPKNRKILGWQGLIPKNKDNIAVSLGNSISSNFFSSDTIMQFLSNEGKIDKTFNWIFTNLKRYLMQKKVQNKIKIWIEYLFRNNSHILMKFIREYSKNNLIEMIDNRVELKIVIHKITEYIEKNIDDGKIDLYKISNRIANEIMIYSPNIAEYINDFIYDYKSKLNWFQRFFSDIFIKVDKEQLESFIYNNLSSKKTRGIIYNLLEEQIVKFNKYLRSKNGQNKINEFLRKNIVNINEFLDKTVIPYIINTIERKLSQDIFWQKLIENTGKLIGYFEKQTIIMLQNNKDNLFNWINAIIPGLLKELNISKLVTNQINNYDTDQLEKLVLDASGEHLIAIEILGGVFGAFAGLILYNMYWFLLAVSAIGIVIAIDLSVSYIKKRI